MLAANQTPSGAASAKGGLASILAGIGQSGASNLMNSGSALAGANTALNADANNQMGIGGQRMDYQQALIDAANQASLTFQVISRWPHPDREPEGARTASAEEGLTAMAAVTCYVVLPFIRDDDARRADRQARTGIAATGPRHDRAESRRYRVQPDRRSIHRRFRQRRDPRPVWRDVRRPCQLHKRGATARQVRWKRLAIV